MPQLTATAEDTQPSTTPASAFAFDSLEAVRRKLLDLSGRNPLLHYKHPSASCIRLIDELPDSIFADLQADKSFCFIPVAAPTERELEAAGYIVKDPATKDVIKQEYPTAIAWAKHKGLSASFDLPEKTTATQGLARHKDSDLQSLLFAPELETKLRAIRGKAETALEEAGANVLYLVLGFLEWYEKGEDNPRYAPLFTIPVQIERGKLDAKEGIYAYTIKQKDDGYLTNVTLREKLAQDFDLALPSIEEDTLPEAYFELIEQTLLKHQPRWNIKRQATLALLDFAKQVMYEDLNPARWPAANNISQHPLIKQFFSAANTATTSTSTPITTANYAVEYAIDDIDNVHELYPLIYEADSSQHSALIDAVRGENLVIEGPPGTGKSQTITNLIAAAIANGKRVLFVAEKMAALEVVKNRLAKAGLGDFCLELHSHKTNKLQVLTDLNNRLTKQGDFRAPKDIAADIERYETLKVKLTEYAELINKPWKNTGWTLHQIFNGAVRYREELPFSTEHLQINTLSGDNLEPVQFKVLADNTGMLADIYHQVAEQAAAGNIANHYWYGVNKIDLAAYQGPELATLLANWNQHLQTLAQAWAQFLQSTAQPAAADVSLIAMGDMCERLSHLPDITGQEPLAAMTIMAAEPALFTAFMADYQSIHRDYERLIQVFKPELIRDLNAQKDVTEAFTAVQALGVSSDCYLAELAGDIQTLDAQVPRLQTLKTAINSMQPQLPSALAAPLNTTLAGLKEFATLVTLVGQLPNELWRYRHDIYDNLDLDPIIAKLSLHLERIKPLQQQLGDHFTLAQLPSTQSLKNTKAILDGGSLLSFLSSDWRTANKDLLALAANARADKNQLIALLPQLLAYRGELDAIEQIHRDDAVLGELYQGVATPIERIASLRAWYQAVRREYGMGFGARVDMGNALIQLDRNLAASLAEPRLGELAADALHILASGDHYSQRFTALKTQLTADLDLLAEPSPLTQLSTALSHTLATLKPWVLSATNPVTALADDIKSLAALNTRTDAWRRSPLGHYASTGPLADYSASDLKAFETCFQLSQQFRDQPAIIAALAKVANKAAYLQIKTDATQLLTHMSDAKASFARFADYGQVDGGQWLQSSQGKLDALIARNQAALQNPAWLNTWLDYIRVKTKLSLAGLGAIITNLEDCQFPPQLLTTVLKHVVYNQLAREALQQNSALAMFSGIEQMATRNLFKDYDKKLLQLQREQVAYKASRIEPPQGNYQGKVADYTETSLIKHEAGKKTRHVPVRSLLKRANTSIRTLKPCFMMSPMSVAQYLTPGEFEFDLVVMDEASQIRPEDALGAIARGKSLVVVGDPKQLPPTSFFQRAINNEEDGDDVVAAEQSESILETVIPMFCNRRLRWHYRSRHESLIAFSNKQFYDQNLVIFPSPFQQSSEFGIVLHRIDKGRFVSRRNSEEAKAIVATVADYLVNQPQKSLGVVAMSAEQKDEIEKQLEQCLKDNPEVAKAFDANRETPEPLFIKNLENVQGDERDSIFISMTYGPEQIGGKTMQRFGPINSDAGGRRLNVLFTRSKKQMHIFSSMGPSDVVVTNTSSRGVRALKAFLEYCETQHTNNAQVTVKAPASDFEASLMRALSKQGYNCEPQLGTPGYFLDIAVRDPANSGHFLMGVECDGVSYHSAKTARDRDRLRQEVLEGLGWQIKRIWSTDWFANPEAQLAPLLAALKEAKTNPDTPKKTTAATKAKAPAEPKETAKPRAQPQASDQKTTVSLKQRLIDFNEQVIIKAQPTTPADQRLLRPAMLEALLNYLPKTKAEFFEVIPPYLRTGTKAEEGEYVNRVVDIIAEDC